jgi:hypothetical protein
VGGILQWKLLRLAPLAITLSHKGRGEEGKNETAREIPAPFFSKAPLAQYLRMSGGS